MLNHNNPNGNQQGRNQARQNVLDRAGRHHRNYRLAGGGAVNMPGAGETFGSFTYSVGKIQNEEFQTLYGQEAQQVTFTGATNGLENTIVPATSSLKAIDISSKRTIRVIRITNFTFNEKNMQAWCLFAWNIPHTVKVLEVHDNSFANISSNEMSEFFKKLNPNLRVICFKQSINDFEAYAIFKPALMLQDMNKRVYVNGEETSVFRLLVNVKSHIIKGNEAINEFNFEDIEFAKLHDEKYLDNVLAKLANDNSPLSYFTQALLLSCKIDCYHPKHSDMQYFTTRLARAVELFAKSINEQYMFPSKKQLAPTTKLLLSLMLEDEQNRLKKLEKLASFDPESIQEYMLFFEYIQKVCATVDACATDLFPHFSKRDYKDIVAFASVHSIPTYEEFKANNCLALVPYKDGNEKSILSFSELSSVVITPVFAEYMRRKMFEQAELVRKSTRVKETDYIPFFAKRMLLKN